MATAVAISILLLSFYYLILTQSSLITVKGPASTNRKCGIAAQEGNVHLLHPLTRHTMTQPPQTTQLSAALSQRYFDRLGLDQDMLDAAPTIAKLRLLQQAHLATIPFENTAQHGVGEQASLDLETTASKILDSKRGGFCLELNILFAAFLVELGYEVTRVPAIVWGSDVDQFRGYPTHVALIVTCEDGSSYFVDVGFGEPPLHPLRYDVTGLEQQTPEGMRSKMVRQENGSVIMYWFQGAEWAPRLKWDYDKSLREEPNSLENFETALKKVQEPSSIFSLKLITCLLTEEYKLTVAGNKLKVTGPTRFPEDGVPSVSVETLESVQAVREVLLERFGIPLDVTAGLDLSKSLDADPAIWSQQ